MTLEYAVWMRGEIEDSLGLAKQNEEEFPEGFLTLQIDSKAEDEKSPHEQWNEELRKTSNFVSPWRSEKTEIRPEPELILREEVSTAEGSL